MKELFEVEYTYDYEYYKKFCKGYRKNIAKMDLTVGIMTVVIIILGILLKNALLLGVALAFPFLMYVRINSTIKSRWDSNLSLQNTSIKVKFYKDSLVQESTLGTTKLEYDKLYNILEIGDSYFFMMSKNQGLMIEKEKCSEGLDEFIIELLK